MTYFVLYEDETNCDLNLQYFDSLEKVVGFIEYQIDTFNYNITEFQVIKGNELLIRHGVIVEDYQS